MGRSTQYRIIIAVVIIVIVVAGCGRGRAEPTPTPTAVPTAAATEASTAMPTEAAAVQAESPLDQPQSPLDQPTSPLSKIDAKDIIANQRVGFDRGAVVNLVNATNPPEPQPGDASLSAVLWSRAKNRTIYGTNCYLTPADVVDGNPVPPTVYLGPKPETGDVQCKTNEQGQLFLDNIPPGDYYLVVWSVYDWPAAFTSPDDSLPVLISVKAGDKLDLGLLYVDWP